MCRPLAFALLLTVFASLPVTAQEYVAGVERDDTYDTREGTDVVMAYFGGTTCFACNIPEFKAALDRAKVQLAERADRDGKTFVALGVALDQSVESGLQFLAGAGPFDEVSAGRNWFNSASLAHLWRSEGFEGRAVGVPAVVVFERDMQIGAAIAASEPRYLVELVGADAIIAWAEAGVPLR